MKSHTAQFIHDKGFRKVALQFPDELLKDSTRVVSALRDNLFVIRESGSKDDLGSVAELFVMADTTYGSCCVDEVGASHVDADCVVHYGHTCLSPTSTLPAYFVFGKAMISESDCARSLSSCSLTSDKPILVLYGLEYAHSIDRIKESVMAPSDLSGPALNVVLHYANVIRSVMIPSEDNITSTGPVCPNVAGNKYNIGGLTWELPEGRSMDEYIIFWIGSENAAFANIVLTFNSSEIGNGVTGENEHSLVEVTQKALQIRDEPSYPIVKGTAKSGMEYFNARSYQGLDLQHEDPSPQSFVTGRTGRAAGYEDEKSR